MIRFFQIITLAIFFSACGKTEISSPSEYIRWMENPANGVKQIRRIGNLEFSLQYKSPEYIMFKERGVVTGKPSPDVLEAVGEMEYYTLSISRLNGTDPLKAICKSEEEYVETFNYYSFNIQKDLLQVTGQDTSECRLAICERTYGIGSRLTLVLGFPPSDLNQDHQIIFYDRYQGAGKVYFLLPGAALSSIPKFKFPAS